MKAKLILAMVICALLSAIVLPVLAQDVVNPLVVKYIRLAYNGRSSTGPDRITGIIYVRDAAYHRVGGAAVSYTWTLPDGTTVDGTGTTTLRQGYLKVSVWEGLGTYTLTVNSVAKDGYDGYILTFPSETITAD